MLEYERDYPPGRTRALHSCAALGALIPYAADAGRRFFSGGGRSSFAVSPRFESAWDSDR